MKEPTPMPPKPDLICVTLYSECNYEGDSVLVCGDFPVIPEKLRQFRVRSVKVPDDIEVTFYLQTHYKEEHITTDHNLECLDVPFNLSFLQLKQSLRRINTGFITNSLQVKQVRRLE
jgi:hypothetical protein